MQALADQGALDNTYLIFTSDNGYIMGNHRREIGKYNQFQGTVKVPFYVRGPGIAPGSTYDDVAGNIDIAPTIAEIAGRQHARTWTASRCCRCCTADRRSRGVLPARPGADADQHHDGERPRGGAGDLRREQPVKRLNDFTGVTNGRYKLIRYTHLPHEELYDLRNDPYELDNLLPTTTRRTPRCRRRAARRWTPSARRWTGWSPAPARPAAERSGRS